MEPLLSSQRPTASELVADQLRMAIQLGRYLPGDRFPPERELSEQLEVSRTTLREAGRLLVAEGLVVAKHGRSGGLVVQDHRMPADEARRLLQGRKNYVTMVFDYRVAIESATVRLASLRRRASDLSSLKRSLAEMDEIMEERSAGRSVVPRWKAADNVFHAGIARAARNDLMEEAVIKVHAEIYQPLNALFDEIQPYMNEPHHAIVAAIEARDPDEAERLMREHIDETRHAVTYYMRTGKIFRP